ncbi:hypothetical protein GCM10007377_06890 [Galliscardovia ingluviei]|uniref:Uncharacterized protein n=1 Tax=Galliscardovia ingluviei TaxID=1769422 RepID=A0A8J3EY90_9BIFI|nr:hypothetical protein [Galliscardovia ingluviei]GGI13624.1 hypothetical protein GCM10007377_06890 [Galliscardovia ingluviei]
MIHDIVTMNKNPVSHSTMTGHQLSLLLTAILGMNLIIMSIKEFDIVMFVASVAVIIVFFLIFEFALYRMNVSQEQHKKKTGWKFLIFAVVCAVILVVAVAWIYVL